ncbi:MAG: YXWGXW repeat-containing protein [Acidobacteria bacterium]|jgi:hypothetical protein|nr:YXWGXW repeat-containing protein [Acidobacteriota bacterium]
MKRAILLTTFLLSLMPLAGCVVEARPPRAVVAVAAPAVYVPVPPPAPVVEVIPACPGPRYVWVRGFYRWSGSAYVWVPGRWAVPPHSHARWVEPEWRHHQRGWFFVEGHWR